MSPSLAKINKIDQNELKVLKRRIDLAMAVIIFATAILVTRLWYLQIQKGEEYAKLSESNRTRIQQIAAPRGNVMDRNGRVIISTRPRFNVVWDAEETANKDEILKELARILGEDISVLLERIRAAADHPRYVPVRLKEDVDWPTMVYIENHRISLPGVSIEAQPSRDYLYGDFASHLIGYLGEISQEELEEPRYAEFQSGDQIGKMGAEKVFEEYLKGEKGRNYLEVDVHGFEQRQLTMQEPVPGNDIQLTLDIDLQLVAEQAMAGKAGAVVAMEVNSGKLLVMCSSPALHLEEFIGGISSKAWTALQNDPLKPLINKTIQGQYPPGSTYKIVTALAGLSEGVITPDTAFYCTGALSFANRRYGCWKKGGHGTVSLDRALTESCDVYFYQVGLKLGVDNLAKYAKSLGLGQKTGIPLEHEKGGVIPTTEWKRQRFKDKWHEGETLSIAIGQGYDLTTPLQICQMTASVVNGGTLYRPQILQSVISAEGNTLKSFTPEVVGKVLGPQHARDLVRNALIGVVQSPSGTAKSARVEGITVGGKTGTAQVVKLASVQGLRELAIPYKYRDHAWFTSFAPAEKPEIAVTVLVEHGLHGGSAAGPIAQVVLQRYFDIKNGKVTPLAEPPPLQTAPSPSAEGGEPAATAGEAPEEQGD
ncbi:MAG: penicillin-binding protein 2 [Thermodesulfobacteriota bacterium]